MSIPPTLLLADDSLTIQRVVSLTFADQAVRVVVAKDGQDAINRMSKDRPDLVLADTNMPCVDGYELARWVRQQPHLSTVPVLLLAGVTDPVDEQRLHDSGANGVLEKPFEPSHVISRVKELLGIKGTPPASGARLVTTGDVKTVAPRKPVPARPAPGVSPDRTDASIPAPAAPDVRPPAPITPLRVSGQEQPGTASPIDGGGPETDLADLGGARGDARDWFGDDEAPVTGGTVSLAEELGVSDLRFYGQSDDAPRARGLDVDFSPEAPRPEPTFAPGSSRTRSAASSTADVFESLLAAEQGDAARPVVLQSAAPDLTPEMLDFVAERVVQRLRPQVLRDELQRGLSVGLREAVAHSVQDSVASETRAAVAEAVQAAVNGTILGTVRGAVNEAIAAAVPAAVDHHAEAMAQTLGARVDAAVRAAVEPGLHDLLGRSLTELVRETVAREMREAVAPLIRQTVQEVADGAVRSAVADAVAAAVPAAVLDAVRGDAGGQVREIVHDTADRLIREEIARIRERRT